MPWRKYEASARDGKYGKVYTIARGIKVRMDHRQRWTLFLEKDGMRKNRTVGEGRDGLVKAIKAAEAIVARGNWGIAPNSAQEPERTSVPTFIQAAEDWYKAGCRRWKEGTQTRYEEALRLHIKPNPVFQKPLDEIGRRDIKDHLREVYKNRSPAVVEIVHGVSASGTLTTCATPTPPPC